MNRENEFDLFVNKAKDAFRQSSAQDAAGTAQNSSTEGAGASSGSTSSWQAPFRAGSEADAYYAAYTGQEPPKKKEKKPKKKFTKRASVRIIAAVLAVVMISAASVGGFVALINAGIVDVGGSSSGGQAFTINQNGDEGSSTTQVNTGEKLTKQQAAAKVLPSVVCIQNLTGSGRDSEPSVSSEGSGIIMSEDGYIITNAHVVDGAQALNVILYDGTQYEATVVGSDSFTDLALIKIDASGLTAAEFGDADELQIGDDVIAIGNPGGSEFRSSATFGSVSAVGRDIANSDGYTMHCIQTDAAINPGNSGGPLVNLYGQVVGINSSKIVAEGYEGLGFAISINEAQPIITSLKEYGYVKDRAVFGISYRMIDSTMARFYGLPVGIYVADINSENVSNAGISKGDVITKVGDTDITSATVFLDYIKDLKPGDTVDVTYYSALSGNYNTTQVVLSELETSNT